jgi:uncharacterized protein (DUF58 family)
MNFVITRRAFLLPLAAGVILLFQNWLPGARVICIGLNALALILIALDYFLLPDPAAFAISRHLPEQLFLNVKDVIGIKIIYDLPIPVRLQILDKPPMSFLHDRQAILCSLPKGYGEADISYEVVPKLRGAMPFDTMGIRLSSPFGLIARQFKVSLKQSTNVFPRLPTEKEGLQSHFYVSQIESRLQRMYGPGREFSQMRDYQRGDDIRSIHWKRSAKSNKLIVREFEPEKGQNVFLVVDGGRLMNAETGGMSKVDWALSSAISLAGEALNKHDSVGILAFSNQVETFVLPSNKKPQLSVIVRAVYGFQPSFMEPDYRHVLLWLQANLKQRCIIILYTDFIDPYLSSELVNSIKVLKRKHRIICCAMGHADMKEIGYQESESLAQATYAAVVRESLDNRRQILSNLTRSGVDIIDVSPDKLCGAVLNRYALARWG